MTVRSHAPDTLLGALMCTLIVAAALLVAYDPRIWAVALPALSYQGCLVWCVRGGRPVRSPWPLVLVGLPVCALTSVLIVMHVGGPYARACSFTATALAGLAAFVEGARWHSRLLLAVGGLLALSGLDLLGGGAAQRSVTDERGWWLTLLAAVLAWLALLWVARGMRRPLGVVRAGVVTVPVLVAFTFAGVGLLAQLTLAAAAWFAVVVLETRSECRRR